VHGLTRDDVVLRDRAQAQTIKTFEEVARQATSVRFVETRR
jgi:hypothetical protein